jgi:hypothetical protein
VTFHKTNKNDIKIEELFQYTSKQEIVKKIRLTACLTIKLLGIQKIIKDVIGLRNIMCRNATRGNFKICVKNLSSCDLICQLFLLGACPRMRDFLQGQGRRPALAGLTARIH